MGAVVTLDVATWRPDVEPGAGELYARELEAGHVLVLPRLPFPLSSDEMRFLDPRWSDGNAKNISFDGKTVKGTRADDSDRSALARMIARFAADATALVAGLFSRYAPHLDRARTSYRPNDVAGRALSWRKDDSRLHVDAFPSRPNRGERILRVFCNVNPRDDRVWRIGEPFEAMARRLLPGVRAMHGFEPAVLATLHVTKGVRSEYDHLMLGLHDRAKSDSQYQVRCPQCEARFAPGTTWICFSDQVMHAAMSGQFMFEQTIHLPLSAMYEPARSPLAILERIAGRRLVPASPAHGHEATA